jgi:hypothetical protein
VRDRREYVQHASAHHGAHPLSPQVRASVWQVETGASVALNAAGAAVEAALHSVRIEQLLATVRAHGFEDVQHASAHHGTMHPFPTGARARL